MVEGKNLVASKDPGLQRPPSPSQKESLGGSFFWLSAFFVVYCARPEDWIPGLSYIPLAKLTGLFGVLGLAMSLGKSKRGFRDVPLEGRLLITLSCLLIAASIFSPVWRGGAFFSALDFAKVMLVWLLIFFVVTSVERLRRIIFIQTISVAVVAIISVAKGHSAPRLEGVLGGIYSNSNDLAFAIVMALPFALMFLLEGRGLLRKVGWSFFLLAMVTALFLTASRAGFIQLVLAGAVCLWYFGFKGKRPQLIVATFLVMAVLLGVAGGKIKDRFFAITGDINSGLDQAAYGSFYERRELMGRSFDGMLRYPIFGVGVNNFTSYSGLWKEVHNSYLQMGTEGGVFALTLYLLFFGCGFRGLKRLKKRPGLPPDVVLLIGALHGSLVGFVVGAMFAPEAYQFFPYFVVAYVSTLAQILREGDAQPATVNQPSTKARKNLEVYANYGRSGTVMPVR